MQTIVLYLCYIVLILLFSTAYNTSLIYCFVIWCLHTNKRRPCSSTLSGHPSSSLHFFQEHKLFLCLQPRNDPVFPSLRTTGSFGGWRCRRYRHVFIKAIESRLAVGGRGCSAKPASHAKFKGSVDLQANYSNFHKENEWWFTRNCQAFEMISGNIHGLVLQLFNENLNQKPWCSPTNTWCSCKFVHPDGDWTTWNVIDDITITCCKTIKALTKRICLNKWTRVNMCQWTF